MSNLHQHPSIFPVIAPPVSELTEDIWNELVDGNRRFCSGKLNRRDLIESRETLVNGQHPKAIVIGCSDSRVPPELIFDQSLGDLFVVRVAGNVIDPIALGSVEYAVEHLHCRLVIVLGHDYCGAVQAACSGHGAASPNLAAIIDELRPAVNKVDLAVMNIRAVVEENALNSAAALITRSSVLHEAETIGALTVFAVRYDLFSGEVIRLTAQ